jgi:hypothetical protein
MPLQEQYGKPGPTATATATFTPTATATAIFTPTATFTPTPRPTATATATPRPTATATFTPTPRPPSSKVSIFKGQRPKRGPGPGAKLPQWSSRIKPEAETVPGSYSEMEDRAQDIFDKAKEESDKKCAEIQEMHRKMTSIEIINKIASRDKHQILEAACEIIALGQDREAIKPLLGLINQIDDLTYGIELGGAFAPNSRFISGAKTTLNFHKDSDECTCNLFGIHEQMNPNKEVEKGYLKIHTITRIEEKWVEFYKASCTRCHQQFKIEEAESHYMWWDWKRV